MSSLHQHLKMTEFSAISVHRSWLKTWLKKTYNKPGGDRYRSRPPRICVAQEILSVPGRCKSSQAVACTTSLGDQRHVLLRLINSFIHSFKKKDQRHLESKNREHVLKDDPLPMVVHHLFPSLPHFPHLHTHNNSPLSAHTHNLNIYSSHVLSLSEPLVSLAPLRGRTQTSHWVYDKPPTPMYLHARDLTTFSPLLPDPRRPPKSPVCIWLYSQRHAVPSWPPTPTPRFRPRILPCCPPSPTNRLSQASPPSPA